MSNTKSTTDTTKPVSKIKKLFSKPVAYVKSAIQDPLFVPFVATTGALVYALICVNENAESAHRDEMRTRHLLADLAKRDGLEIGYDSEADHVVWSDIVTDVTES